MRSLDPIALVAGQQTVALPSPDRPWLLAQLANASMYSLNVRAGGNQRWVPAWRVETVPVNSASELVIDAENLSLVQAGPQATLLVTLAVAGEPFGDASPLGLSMSIESPELLAAAVGSALAGPGPNFVAGSLGSFGRSIGMQGGRTLRVLPPQAFTGGSVVGDTTGTTYWGGVIPTVGPLDVVVDPLVDPSVTLTLSGGAAFKKFWGTILL